MSGVLAMATLRGAAGAGVRVGTLRDGAAGASTGSGIVCGLVVPWRMVMSWLDCCTLTII